MGQRIIVSDSQESVHFLRYKKAVSLFSDQKHFRKWNLLSCFHAQKHGSPEYILNSLGAQTQKCFASDFHSIPRKSAINANLILGKPTGCVLR